VFQRDLNGRRDGQQERQARVLAFVVGLNGNWTGKAEYWRVKEDMIPLVRRCSKSFVHGVCDTESCDLP